MSYNHRGRESRPNRLEIRLSARELEQLNWVCAQIDRPASHVVRLAIEKYASDLGGYEEPSLASQSQDTKRDG